MPENKLTSLDPAAQLAAVAATFIATAISLVAGGLALKAYKPITHN